MQNIERRYPKMHTSRSRDTYSCNHKIFKLREFVIGYKFILSTKLFRTWIIFSCFDVDPDTCGHALVHTLFIDSVILIITMGPNHDWIP